MSDDVESIPVNDPMCDRCGKNFLDCRCQMIHSVEPAPSQTIELDELIAKWRENSAIYATRYDEESKRNRHIIAAQQGALATAFKCCADELERIAASFAARVRLSEAKWWEHLVGAVEPNHPEGRSETCMYCEHIVELERAAQGKEQQGGRGNER